MLCVWLLQVYVFCVFWGERSCPLSQKEIDRIISQIKGEVAVAQEKSDFVVGSEVDINEGPFAGFVGIIDKIDEENERLTVMVVFLVE